MASYKSKYKKKSMVKHQSNLRKFHFWLEVHPEYQGLRRFEQLRIARQQGAIDVDYRDGAGR